MRATFEAFRASYAAAYLDHHQRYWQSSARLCSLLDEAAPTARALARLNTLPALGRPVGRAALAGYERLTRRQRICPGQDLESTLRERPACPDCNLTLEDAVAQAE